MTVSRAPGGRTSRLTGRLTRGSYATFDVASSLRQVRHAWRERGHATRNMLLLLDAVRLHEARMVRKLGRPLESLSMLEIGPGQGMERARYFARANEVVAVDLDVIPQGIAPRAYLAMLIRNGVGRLVKTVGRHLIVGQANTQAWAKVAGTTADRTLKLINADICRTVPAVGAFDVVMSWSVFEHLTDPHRALANAILALRPGGILYISIHLYTANNGHHDIRAFTGGEGELPLWGHLRPSTRHLIRPSSYLNEWRLAQWRSLFSSLAPGAEEVLETQDHKEKWWSQMTPELRHDLRDYADEELVTVDAVYLWQKPLR